MSAIFFLAALLAGLLATAVALIISLGNGASQFLGSITRNMGPGVIHNNKPVKYTLAYLLLTLAVALFIAGIYHIGS